MKGMGEVQGGRGALRAFTMCRKPNCAVARTSHHLAPEGIQGMRAHLAVRSLSFEARHRMACRNAGRAAVRLAVHEVRPERRAYRNPLRDSFGARREEAQR